MRFFSTEFSIFREELGFFLKEDKEHEILLNRIFHLVKRTRILPAREIT